MALRFAGLGLLTPERPIRHRMGRSFWELEGAYFQNRPLLLLLPLVRPRRPAHIRQYIHRPEKLKNSSAMPDRIEIAVPTMPNSSPEWIWWKKPFHAAMPVAVSGGLQRQPSGQTKPAGGSAAASCAVVDSACGHRSAAWLSSPVEAMKNRNRPKITLSQRCHLRIGKLSCD